MRAGRVLCLRRGASPGESTPSSGKGRCKGPEAGEPLVFLGEELPGAQGSHVQERR